MIDYIINEENDSIVSGSTNKADKFAELWKFIRNSNGWVLDEIDQNVEITDLTGFKSFSEELQK